MTCPQCTLALSRAGLALEAEAQLAQGPQPHPPRQGQGQWVGARLRFTGDAQAAPGREATLDNLLNIIGRRAGPRALITLG